MNQSKIFSALVGTVAFLAAQVFISNSAFPQCCKPASQASTEIGVNSMHAQQSKTEKVKLKITGLTCAGCAGHLNKVLSETNGIINNSVEYPGDLAVVEYDSKKITPDEIIKAIEDKTSYKAVIHKEETNSKS